MGVKYKLIYFQLYCFYFIREMMLLEQEEKLLEKSMNKLEEGLIKLKTERNEKEKSMEQLHMKYNCIQNFDKTVVSTVLIIF